MSKTAQILKENGVEYVYQPIKFTNNILEHYNAGNHFKDLDIEEERKRGALATRIKSAGVNGFMPTLVKELTEVIGAKNQKYDGYEFGKNEINFYFLLKKKEYHSIIEKIKEWRVKKDFKKIMQITEKKV